MDLKKTIQNVKVKWNEIIFVTCEYKKYEHKSICQFQRKICSNFAHTGPPIQVLLIQDHEFKFFALKSNQISFHLHSSFVHPSLQIQILPVHSSFSIIIQILPNHSIFFYFYTNLCFGHKFELYQLIQVFEPIKALLTKPHLF